MLAILLVAIGQAVVMVTGLVVATGALRLAVNGFSLLPLGAVLLAVLVAQQVLQAARSVIGTVLRQDTVAEITTDVLTAVGQVPFEQLEDSKWQGTVGLALREATFRPGFLIDNVIAVVESGISLIGVFAAAVGVFGPLVLLLPVLVVPALAVESRLRQRIVGVQTRSAPELMRMQFLAQLSVDADWQRDLRANASTVVQDEYRRLAAGYLPRLRTVLVRTEAWRVAVSVLVIALIVVAGLTLVSTSRPDAASIAILLGVLWLAGNYLHTLVSAIGEVLTAAEYLRILGDVMAEHEDAPGRPQAARRLLPADRIELRDVHYAYSAQTTREAVAGVDLTVGAGLTAITGPNGAGKSTLVKMLAGLIGPQRGEIVAVGPSGARIAWPDIGRAVLFQNTPHLRLTVRQNLTLDLGTGDDARAWQVLDAVGLDEVVRALPAGLDTQLGSGFGGEADLSGGQWQRLAVARLLYTDASVIICDEPATGLDAEGERWLMDRLGELATHRFVIVVTHRLETMKRCDQVVVLDDGRLVAPVTAGTPARTP